MTHEEWQMLWVCLGVIGITVILYILKFTPLSFLWRWWCMFWFILLATLFVGMISDDMKKWINKLK